MDKTQDKINNLLKEVVEMKDTDETIKSLIDKEEYSEEVRELIKIKILNNSKN